MRQRHAKTRNLIIRTQKSMRQLALKLETSSEQAAKWARQLDNAERGHRSTVIGLEKKDIILEHLNGEGWSLKHFVSRCLPLLSLPEDLQTAIKSGWIAARHASALKGVRSERTRKAIIDELRLRPRHEPVTLELVRALVQAARDGDDLETVRRPVTRSVRRGNAQDADPAVLELLARLEDHFGSRVTLQGFALTIHAETLEGLNGVIDRLELDEY
jgi:ParB-like chromosome segregation protein Spo0J